MFDNIIQGGKLTYEDNEKKLLEKNKAEETTEECKWNLALQKIANLLPPEMSQFIHVEKTYRGYDDYAISCTLRLPKCAPIRFSVKQPGYTGVFELSKFKLYSGDENYIFDVSVPSIHGWQSVCGDSDRFKFNGMRTRSLNLGEAIYVAHCMNEQQEEIRANLNAEKKSEVFVPPTPSLQEKLYNVMSELMEKILNGDC